MKKDYTHLTLVVDRSGSMSSMKAEAQEGIKTLLKEQFALPGRLTVTLVEFDDHIETVARLATKTIDYELEPRGMTALMDAVGSEIIKTGSDLRDLKEGERPSKVLFVVVTDGMENSSHEYKLEKVKELIAKQRDEYKWNFQFLGAGEAAWQGEQLGMRSSAYQANPDGMAATYAVTSSAMRSYREDSSPDAAFVVPETIK